MGTWSPETIAKVAGAVPASLWAILAILAFAYLRKPIVASLERATNVEAFGVKLALAVQAVNLAVEVAAKHRDWNVTVPPEDRDAVLERAKRERELLRDAEILWVDDKPTNNRNEARMLTALGAHITFAADTPEALATLQSVEAARYPFDLVISDMKRGEDATAGIHMLAAFIEKNLTQPVVFYIGQVAPGLPLPVGAFGLTERPDRLLHLALDALARRPLRYKPTAGG